MNQCLVFVWFEGREHPVVRMRDRERRYWKRGDGKVARIRRATVPEERDFYLGRLDVASVPLNGQR